MRRMYRKVTAGVIAAAMLMGMSGCGSSKPAETTAATKAETTAAATEAVTTEAATEAAQATGEKTEIQVFIAASLNTVMQDLAKLYNEQHPEVTITFNADSSGKLLTQIEEGYACDVFFSAAQKQMNTLDEEDKLVVEGTRKNVVNNQVCVITTKDSGTKVTGLQNIGEAASIALADGSVPVGKYTRQAMAACFRRRRMCRRSRPRRFPRRSAVSRSPSSRTCRRCWRR